MASNIKGITIEIGGNTQPLNNALEGVNKKSKDLQSELKSVERLLKLDPTNTTLLAQKQELLSQSVANTKDKLDTLKTAEKQVQEQFKNGEIGEEQYRALQREIANTETSLKSLEKQAKTSDTAMSASLKNVGDKLTNVGQKLSIVSAGIAAGVGAAAAGAVETADELVRLADETGLSIEKLQELGYVGRQVGVDLETIAGAQAKLTKSMNAARDGTGTQADAFKALEISVTDANGNLKDAKDVMGEAFEALGSVGNETERDALSMAIFGKSAMDLNPLIKLGADGLSEMEQKAHDVGAVMSDESVAALDDFGDSLEGLKMSVMGAVGESLTPLIDKLTSLMNWFSNLDSGTKSIILAILAVIAAVGPLLLIVGQIMSLMSSLSIVAGALGISVGAIAAPVLLVIAAIAAIIAIGVLLYKNWDTIKEKAGQLGSWISEKWDGITSKTSEVWGNVKDAIGNAVGAAKDVVQEKLGNIKQAYEENGGGVKGAVAAMFEGVKGYYTAGFDFINNLTGGKLDGIKNAFSEKLNAAKDIVYGIIEKIKSFFSFDWNLPRLKMPHINISGKWDINPFDGDGISAPKFSIDWYKTGAIFTKPSVIGVGENPNSPGEAVLPIEKIDGIMASAIKKAGGTGSLEGATIYNYMVVDGEVLAQSYNKVKASNIKRYEK